MNWGSDLSLSDLPTYLFDEEERRALREATACLDCAPGAKSLILGKLQRLIQLGELVRSFPSLREEERLGKRYRDSETLLEHLASGPPGSPLHIPVKARLSRDFVLAKAQMFRAMLHALETPQCAVAPALRDALSREAGQSMFTFLGERVLEEILADDMASPEVHRRAGDLLVKYWDESVHLEIDDFCPVLNAAWEARNRLVLDFGTLMGSVETVRLIVSAGNPTLVELFVSSKGSAEEKHAFEEFLFGLSYEQLKTLRKKMRKQNLSVVDRFQVAETLGLPVEKLFSGVRDPEAMFDSYYERRLAASFRHLRNARGPHHTAEMFLMMRVLERA
jgi:hypothetical protein